MFDRIAKAAWGSLPIIIGALIVSLLVSTAGDIYRINETWKQIHAMEHLANGGVE